MELYLNEIYLGDGSYGIASASLNYFNKSLDDLSIDEMALLAALPKAPSSYNPYKNPIRALKRRNWVLKDFWMKNSLMLICIQKCLTKKLISREIKKY